MWEATLSTADWPQWRGAERLGIWTETGILREFPDEGLAVKWRAPVNGGYAGPAVASGRVFVLDYVETEPAYGTERIVALDEAAGGVLWTHEWDTTYRMLMMGYATGPRATPTVDGDRVYLTGATGPIFSLDAATGEVIWEKDTVAEVGARIPFGVRRSRRWSMETASFLSPGASRTRWSWPSTSTPERRSGERWSWAPRWATAS